MIRRLFCNNRSISLIFYIEPDKFSEVTLPLFFGRFQAQFLRYKEQKHSFVWYHSYKVQTFNIKFVLTKRVTNKQLSTIYVLQKMIIPKTVKVTCFVLCLNVISLALYLTFNPCNLPKTQIQSPFKMSCNFKHKNVYDLQYKIYPKLLPISL